MSVWLMSACLYPCIVGPDFWGLVNNQWRMCSSGQMQSPINIDPNILLYDPNLTPVEMDKNQVEHFSLPSFFVAFSSARNGRGTQGISYIGKQWPLQYVPLSRWTIVCFSLSVLSPHHGTHITTLCTSVQNARICYWLPIFFAIFTCIMFGFSWFVNIVSGYNFYAFSGSSHPSFHVQRGLWEMVVAYEWYRIRFESKASNVWSFQIDATLENMGQLPLLTINDSSLLHKNINISGGPTYPYRSLWLGFYIFIVSSCMPLNLGKMPKVKFLISKLQAWGV